MPPRNRPNSHKHNSLTGNGGRIQGAAPGSTRKGNAPAPPRASSPALRWLFAPITPAAAEAVTGGSGNLAADVDELVGPFGRQSRDAVVGAAQIAAAAPAAGLGTCAVISSVPFGRQSRDAVVGRADRERDSRCGPVAICADGVYGRVSVMLSPLGRALVSFARSSW